MGASISGNGSPFGPVPKLLGDIAQPTASNPLVLPTGIKEGSVSDRCKRLLRIHLTFNVRGHWDEFAVRLLLAMGYCGSREDSGQIVGQSGDGGIDGVIDQDAFGPRPCLRPGETGIP